MDTTCGCVNARKRRSDILQHLISPVHLEHLASSVHFDSLSIPHPDIPWESQRVCGRITLFMDSLMCAYVHLLIFIPFSRSFQNDPLCSVSEENDTFRGTAILRRSPTGFPRQWDKKWHWTALRHFTKRRKTNLLHNAHLPRTETINNIWWPWLGLLQEW